MSKLFKFVFHHACCIFQKAEKNQSQANNDFHHPKIHDIFDALLIQNPPNSQHKEMHIFLTDYLFLFPYSLLSINHNTTQLL